MKRRTLIKIAGAAPVAVAFAGLAQEAEAATNLYGSGVLSDWTKMSKVSYGSFNTADVGIFGDSITVGSWSALNTLVQGAGKTLAVNAQSGRPTDPAVDVLEAWLKAGNKVPKNLLMMTGSNDIFNPPVMAGEIERVKNLLTTYSPTTTLWWGNTYVDRWAQTSAVRLADGRNSNWVNNQIEAHAPHVIRWFEDIAAKPARAGWYLRDGLHPNDTTGKAHWAAVVFGAIRGSL